MSVYRAEIRRIISIPVTVYAESEREAKQLIQSNECEYGDHFFPDDDQIIFTKNLVTGRSTDE